MMDGARAALRGRLFLGGGVLIFGWLCPLFVPLVVRSELSTQLKATVSGLLLLGIPELFTIAALAILGKPGFEYLTGFLFRYLRRLAPPERVGRTRYQIGLVMFAGPLLIAWISDYVPGWIPAYVQHPIAYAITLDVVFFSSLFVLGGEFWDKFRALFVHGAQARFP